MQTAVAKLPSDRQVPPTVYTALVQSMCQNSRPMLTGTICAAAAALTTAAKTGNIWIWPCAILIVAIGTLRAFQMRRYENLSQPLTLIEAQEFERKYRLGAVAYAASLGAWCMVVLLGSADPVAHMLCTTVTIGYTAGGAARNYGRPKIVQWHILCACGPMSLALALHGDPYYFGLSVLLLLFFVGLRIINLNLHDIFVKALLATERVASIAKQFDIALNNMPHGLCMFSPQGDLAVINQRFSAMMTLAPGRVATGMSALEIITACAEAGAISEGSGRKLLAAITRGRSGDIVTVDPKREESRAFSWTLQPMESGGTVLLVEDITERRAAEARITHLARFDELTALPNRVHFRNEVERLLNMAEDERHAALLFVDLDQFKQVNDSLGHPCGDELLCAVALRLREMLAPDQFVARFGGDEFVVFQPNIRNEDDVAFLARRIVDRLSERYNLGGQIIEIGASVGIAIATLDVDADTLIKHADLALFRAKSSGRGRICFFEEEMAHTVAARRTLELELRRALAENEFELYFQPLVNLKTGRISTCEALLRWNHPQRGIVSPVDIVPVAEDMGLIDELGSWILKAACNECKMWPDPVSVAVNISPQQFRHDVVREVQQAMSQSGLPSHRLEIEITESSLLGNTQSTNDALAQLHAAGVRISLDDFGTGYSSLSYLHNFPLNKVKIDRSFLEGIDSARPLTLLRGIARLSNELGMSVVVEGVETSRQLEIISVDGTVTEVQGYLFSRPVPALQVRQLLAASHGFSGSAAIEMRA